MSAADDVGTDDPGFADFDDIDTPEQPEPSATFKLGGRDWHVANRDDVPFQAVASMWTAQTDVQAFLAVEPFFRGALVPEERDDFIAMIRAADSKFTLSRMRPVIGFVSQALFGRPTEPAVPSSRGRSGSGPKSTAGSSSRGTRRRASAS